MSQFLLVWPASFNLVVNLFMPEQFVLTPAERAALRAFQKFLATPEQMICFFGPTLEKHGAALERLTKKHLLVKENFKGAWSLTVAGYQAMKTCDE